MDNNELIHWGVKGMRWGVRKDRTDSSSSGSRKRRNADSEDSVRVQQIRKKKVSQMSNKELEDANRRLNLERNYKDLTRTKSRGKKAIDAFVSTAGTIAAVTAAYGTYKKLGVNILAKIGKMKV